MQDAEIRTGIVTAYLKPLEAQRKPYQDLLNELNQSLGWGSPMYLSQSELSYDWPSCVARPHAAAAELAGVKSDAKWGTAPAVIPVTESVLENRTCRR